MVDAQHKKRRILRKRVLFTVAISTLLIAIIAALVYYFTIYVPSQTSKVQSTEQKISEIIASANQTDDATAQKQELQALAQQESDSAKKAEYLAAATDLYASSGDTKGTLEVAKQYEQTAKSAESAGSLASAYEQTGDYANAARYYGVASERSPKPASEVERAAYNDYRLLQKEMEAKQ